MTAEQLKAFTAKDLGQMAKKKGVQGWHSMRKDQLVRALLRVSKKKRPAAKSAGSKKSTSSRKTTARRTPTKKAAAGRSTSRSTTSRSSKSRTSSRKAAPKSRATNRRIEQAKAKRLRSHNLSASAASNGAARDRLVVMVLDSFWLKASWELSRQGVDRAKAALGQSWHAARPVLRLYEVPSRGNTSSASESVVRDIEIHGGVTNWYVDVSDPPKSYRLDIGYLAPDEKFHCLARSNVVSTPKFGSTDQIDRNWDEVARDFEKVYAQSGGNNGHSNGELQELFEERLRRPMTAPVIPPGVTHAANGRRRKEFEFEVDAEMIFFGQTDPEARVTLQGDPVKLRPDGTFTVRFSMPDCRQVIPVVAQSVDGAEQRTVVLAVERNTKTMEPLTRDNQD